MQLQAKISREWRDRMIIVLILLLGSAGWFFYDGAVSYPAYNEKADAYAEIQRVYGADETLANEKWKALAIERHWDTEDLPKKRKNEEQQFHWCFGLLVATSAFLIWMLRDMRRVIVATDDCFTGISTAFPPFNPLKKVHFASVRGIDKRRWEKKGIAVVHYKNEDGEPRTVYIDDYKYVGSEKILERCEEILEEKKRSRA